MSGECRPYGLDKRVEVRANSGGKQTGSLPPKSGRATSYNLCVMYVCTWVGRCFVILGDHVTRLCNMDSFCNHTPQIIISLRLGAHWQLNSCGDKKVAVNVRALQLNSCLYRQLFFFQYRMAFTETACVCALLLRIRKDRRKKRHWVHPVASKRL
jgi:hypothetical protein